MAEKPQMEQVAPEEQAQEAAGGADIQALVSELEKLQVTTPEDVRGMATAAQQAGRLANLLGESNQRIASLEAQIANLRTTPSSPPIDASSFEGGSQVDLGHYIKNKSKEGLKELIAEMSQEQARAQTRLQNDMARVQSHPQFAIVKDEFERLLKDPTVGQQVYSGQSNLLEVFTQATFNKLNAVAGNSLNVLKKFGQAGNIQPPHMEGGANRSVPGPTTNDERAQKLKTLEKKWQGGNKDIEDALSIILGSQ